MSDVASLTLLAEAQRRLLASPQAVDLAVHAVRTDAGFARRNHPRGHVWIDQRMVELLRSITEAATPCNGLSAVTGRWTPEALLRAEAGAAEMRDLRAEGAAEEKRSSDIRIAANHEDFRQRQNEGWQSISSARLTAPIRERTAALRLALDSIDEKLNHKVDSDAAYLSVLLDLEEALRPVGTTIGLERRVVKPRVTAARAKSVADRALAVKEAA